MVNIILIKVNDSSLYYNFFPAILLLGIPKGGYKNGK
jgi:hypothetical protein